MGVLLTLAGVLHTALPLRIAAFNIQSFGETKMSNATLSNYIVQVGPSPPVPGNLGRGAGCSKGPVNTGPAVSPEGGPRLSGLCSQPPVSLGTGPLSLLWLTGRRPHGWETPWAVAAWLLQGLGAGRAQAPVSTQPAPAQHCCGPVPRS